MMQKMRRVFSRLGSWASMKSAKSSEPSKATSRLECLTPSAATLGAMRDDPEVAKVACDLIEQIQPHLPEGMHMTLIISRQNPNETIGTAMVSPLDCPSLRELLTHSLTAVAEESMEPHDMPKREVGN